MEAPGHVPSVPIPKSDTANHVGQTLPLGLFPRCDYGTMPLFIGTICILCTGSMPFLSIRVTTPSIHVKRNSVTPFFEGLIHH